jgi:hypothetical protein
MLDYQMVVQMVNSTVEKMAAQLVIELVAVKEKSLVDLLVDLWDLLSEAKWVVRLVVMKAGLMVLLLVDMTVAQKVEWKVQKLDAKLADLLDTKMVVKLVGLLAMHLVAWMVAKLAILTDEKKELLMAAMTEELMDKNSVEWKVCL